jgi:hypothetical protein
MHKLTAILFFSAMLAVPVLAADPVILNLHLEGNAIDSSSYAHAVYSLDLNGEPATMQYEAACAIGGCMRFTGEGEHLETNLGGAGSVPDDSTTAPVSVSLWLKASAANANQLQLFSPDVFDNAYRGAALIDGTNVILRDGDSAPTTLFAIPGDYTDEMHQLTIAYDAEGATGYWDGKKQGFAPGVRLDLGEPDVVLGIGGGKRIPFGNPFAGLIDEVHVFNLALSGEQAGQLYTLEYHATAPADLAQVFATPTPVTTLAPTPTEKPKPTLVPAPTAKPKPTPKFERTPEPKQKDKDGKFDLPGKKVTDILDNIARKIEEQKAENRQRAEERKPPSLVGRVVDFIPQSPYDAPTTFAISLSSLLFIALAAMRFNEKG